MGVILVIQHFIIFAVLTFLGAVFWVMLTMCEPYGYGDLVYLKMTEAASYFEVLGAMAAGMTVTLVVLDVIYWKRIFFYLGRLLMVINVGLYYLTALAGTQRFPSSPVAVYFTLCPFVLYLLRVTLMSKMDPLSFLFTTGASLLFVSAASLGLFLAYAFGYGNFWNDKIRVDFYTRLGCIPPNTFNGTIVFDANLTLFLDNVDVNGACDEGFLFWMSPLILILFTFAMGAAVLLIVHSERAYAKGKSRIDLQVRAFCTFLLLGFLGLYCATGIGGADIGLSSVVFAFTFLMMVIGCSAIIFVEGINNFSSGVKQQPLVARVLGWAKSDWMRSLLLVLFFPLFFVIIPLAFLNQFGRKWIPITKQLDEEERKLYLSIEISSRLNAMRKWHWTSILCKVIWWGVIFFSLSVIGARFINVFFSWLQETFQAYGIGIAASSAIFVVVGWFCFILPPIPGVPVYIACSVIIVPVCVREGWDFFLAWIYCSFLCLFMRLLAVAGNQILIGQWFGSNSVAVRRAVGVNSVEIRAIKRILMEKGLTKAKVAALVGGPDWPMCVCAGILRTSPIQSVLGSSPVFFVILPVTLAGALILRRNEGGVWSSAATMALAITGLIQTIMLGAAAYYIENTVQTHREELQSWPDDEEVKKFDEISNVKARARSYVSEWHRLPTWLKLVLMSGVVAETASAYLFQLFGSRCFLNFDITDDIETVLQNNVLNIVKPLGWVGIGLFAFGCVVLIILGRWISYTVKHVNVPQEEEERLRRMSEAGEVDPEPLEEDLPKGREQVVVAPSKD